MLARSRAVVMKAKMGVFDGRHFDVRVLVNHPGAEIMAEVHPGDRHCAAAVSGPDLRADGEVLQGGFDQVFRPRRAIDMDRLGGF